MATNKENFTCRERQRYQSIYSPGFGTDSSQFFSKDLYFPRTGYDMDFGKRYQPSGMSRYYNSTGSRYDGQWFIQRENFRTVSGRRISGV